MNNELEELQDFRIALENLSCSNRTEVMALNYVLELIDKQMDDLVRSPILPFYVQTTLEAL